MEWIYKVSLHFLIGSPFCDPVLDNLSDLCAPGIGFWDIGTKSVKDSLCGFSIILFAIGQPNQAGKPMKELVVDSHLIIRIMLETPAAPV